MFIADLHIHSKYSRATSGDCDLPHLDLWARKKGIHLVGTGDFTHPKWRQEMSEMLSPLGNGFYALKEEYRLPCAVPGAAPPQFVLSSEISTIYKRDGKTRKVHHVILLPDLESAEEFSHRLEAIGNLHSDGRPILGLDSRDLLEILLDCCPEFIYIPAHIWTPHFSLFGAFSGFDSIQECYGDLSCHIHALETGLSSDPLMNRRLSALDGHVLVSNSDAHSPQKLGREANLLACALSFSALKTALDTGDGFAGTIEFFPEEGKYHMDGHRACQRRLTPEETLAYQGRCPVCGKKVTVGVSHRAEVLSDRKEPCTLPHPFESLVPLPEIMGECLGVSAASKKAQNAYEDLLQKLGPEFTILREKSIIEIEDAAGPLLAEAIARLRRGQVIRQAGYDGEYGIIRLFENGEKEIFLGQTSLLAQLSLPDLPTPIQEKIQPAAAKKDAQEENIPLSLAPNAAQQAAILSDSPVICVIAGPGTGKTGTLVNRIVHLITEKGVSPREITAVTFTRQAAREMQERLEKRLGKKAVRGLTIGTFHAICLSLIEKKPLVSRRQALDILKKLLTERGEKISPARALSLISAEKNDLPASLPAGLRAQYDEALHCLHLRDLDDVMLDALKIPVDKEKRFQFLLVDEFQDINAIQRQLVQHWGKNHSLFVIGDPDQSIYGFRGANSSCFDDLLMRHPAADVIRLSQNYRSAPAIIDCALSVIRHNPGMERALTSTHPQGLPVRWIQCADEYAQGPWIAKEISRLSGGVDMLESQAQHQDRARYAFSDIAVLCRTHHQLEQIEHCLRHESIPCLISAREDFWEDETVEALLGFFAALTEPENPAPMDLSLRKLFHCPAGLIHQAQQALSLLPDHDAFLQALSAFDGLSAFRAAAEKILPRIAKDKPRKLLDPLIDACGCKGKAVDALKNSALFHENIAAFLQYMAACEEGDFQRQSGGKASGAVRLMTLHAAKGLEFPVVILSGLDTGKLPLERPDEICNMEEERRLFFVGITRAREELILTCGDSPSPFLQELPENIQIEKQKKAAYTQRVQQMSLF